MGKVIEKVKLINYDDVSACKRGYVSKEEIRFLETDAIIDTGSVMSSLPRKIVEQLGLLIEPENQVRLVYADGRKESVPKANGLTIIMFGRNWTGECICQENSDHVIIGQIPLEQMDLVVDCNKQAVYPNPENPDQVTLLAL
ncbi:MAG: clan AA aspartic protease [Leptospiraceae bacterium]|nr:hypothetical protein [Leptospiraceae bacterium]MCP5497904.1 clan AA aspartic protease [Leptospiraceae bacterium]